MNIWFNSGLGEAIVILGTLGLCKLIDYIKHRKSSDDQQSSELELKNINGTYILS